MYFNIIRIIFNILNHCLLKKVMCLIFFVVTFKFLVHLNLMGTSFNRICKYKCSKNFVYTYLRYNFHVIVISNLIFLSMFPFSIVYQRVLVEIPGWIVMNCTYYCTSRRTIRLSVTYLLLFFIHDERNALIVEDLELTVLP